MELLDLLDVLDLLIPEITAVERNFNPPPSIKSGKDMERADIYNHLVGLRKSIEFRARQLRQMQGMGQELENVTDFIDKMEARGITDFVIPEELIRKWDA